MRGWEDRREVWRRWWREKSVTEMHEKKTYYGAILPAIRQLLGQIQSLPPYRVSIKSVSFSHLPLRQHVEISAACVSLNTEMTQ
jgi:hypothetical protein